MRLRRRMSMAVGGMVVVAAAARCTPPTEAPEPRRPTALSRVPGRSIDAAESVSGDSPDLKVDLNWAFAGCSEVRAGPVCEAETNAQIRVWARTPVGVLLTPEHPGLAFVSVAPRDGGRRWTFRLTSDRGRIVIQARHRGRTVRQPLEVRRFEAIECPLALPESASSVGSAQAGTTDAVSAVEALESRVAELPADRRPDCWLSFVFQARQKTELTAVHRRWLERARVGFERRGRRRSALRAVGARAYFLVEARRADEARAIVEPWVFDASINAGLRVPLLNTYGFAAFELADLAEARRVLEQARTWSIRLGDETQWMWAARYLISTLERAGDWTAAERLAKSIPNRAVAIEDSCLAKGALASVHFWSILRRTRPFASIDEPIADHVAAVDLAPLRARMMAGLEDCRILRVEVAANLALEAVLRMRPDEATGYLAKAERWAEQGGAPRRMRQWLSETRVRVDLARGDSKGALARIRGLQQQVDLPPMLEWMLAVHRAEAFRRLGSVRRTDAAWRSATQIVERWPGVIALDRSYGGLASSLHRATQAHVGFLQSQGRVREAADVARWARVRALLAARRSDRIAALSRVDRARWRARVAEYQRLRAEQDAVESPSSVAEARRARATHRRLGRAAEQKLRAARRILWASTAIAAPRPPDRGELSVVIQPDRDRWTLMVVDAEAAMAVPLDRLGEGPPRLSSIEAGLATVAAQVDRARVIRVVTVGSADQLDVHAVRFRGSSLLRHRPVLYGLDVGSTATGSATTGPGRALIVADPAAARRLPRSRAEASAARAALAGRGWSTVLMTDDIVLRAPVVAMLDQVDLFHFAGHGVAPQGYLTGGLQLANGQMLAVSDVLALNRGPRVAVLSACESGTERHSGALGPALGVAQAFVLAGASMVVATTREVQDEVAAEVGRAIHRAAAYDPVTAAQVLGRSVDANRDGAAFRIYVK